MEGFEKKMTIERNALLSVVKAARMALRLAEDTQKLFVDKAPWSVADEIAGQLADALFKFSHDKAERFSDSTTMRLLKGDLNDGAVTDWFLMMYRIDERRNKQEEPEQPAPNVISKEELQDLYKNNGGYVSPEGDWT